MSTEATLQSMIEDVEDFNQGVADGECGGQCVPPEGDSGNYEIGWKSGHHDLMRIENEKLKAEVTPLKNRIDWLEMVLKGAGMGKVLEDNQ